MPRPSPKMYKVIAVIGVLLLCGAIYALLHYNEQSTDDAAIEAHVVTVSPKVSGYVKTLFVRDNQPVKAGDVLFEIDPADYLIRRDHAKAVLEAAHAGRISSTQNFQTVSISAPSNLDAAKAQVAAARANWEKSHNDLMRFEHLSNEARSREQLDAAVAAEKTAASNLEDAKAKLRSAQTSPKAIATARANEEAQAAQVKQAEADLAQAEKDLADTMIIAPMDGHVTRRSGEVGDYVTPGVSLGYLVGNDLWIIANFKETQLTHMQPGDRVEIRVDAFPAARVNGKVDSIQSGTGARFSAFPPENATGNFVKIVQRVPVKILLDRQPGDTTPLGPGMSVVPTVFTSR